MNETKMLIASACYGGAAKAHEEHKRRVAELANCDLSITEAIKLLNAIYLDIWWENPYEINCGHCEDFANDLLTILSDGKETDNCCLLWADDLEPNTKARHAFLRYKGRYYDSESPEGEEHWQMLGANRPFCEITP